MCFSKKSSKLVGEYRYVPENMYFGNQKSIRLYLINILINLKSVYKYLIYEYFKCIILSVFD